jgi:predicted phosphohydrolase
MQNNIQFFLFSDIHLENKSDSYSESLLLAFQKKIEECQKQNIKPIFVFAGDIHNSIKAYDWMKKIHASIIYVAGNHEFWGEDYYETIEKLQQEAPSNVRFLHNDFCVIDDYLILGSTLWTDLGQQLNPDLFTHVNHRMNDNRTIYAKKWYENSENVQKFEAQLARFEKQYELRWNGFIEIAENKKAFDFFNNIGEFLRILKKNEVMESSSLNDFLKIFQEKYPHDKISLYGDLFFIESLFEKLKKIPDLHHKKIIIVSHHLPFYEELQIASFPYQRETSSIINDVDEDLFKIRRTEDYPPGYLHELAHYRIDEQRDLSIIANYHNHGKELLHPFLLDNIKLWMHGHKHTFAYSDFIGNIQIFTNPLAYQLPVSKKDDANAIQNILKSPIPFLEKKDIASQTVLWLLQNIDWKKLESTLQEIVSYSEEYLVKVKNKNSKELYPLTLTIKDYIQQLYKEMFHIQKAFNIRCNQRYSITNLHQKFPTKTMDNILFKPFLLLETSYYLPPYHSFSGEQTKRNLRFWISLGRFMQKNWDKLQKFANSIEHKNLGYYSEKDIQKLENLIEKNHLLFQKIENKIDIMRNKRYSIVKNKKDFNF